MFDELKEVKYFKENRLQESYDVKHFKKNKTFEESSKNRDVFRTQESIYDGALLWIYLMAYYFRNKSFIIDVRLD